MGLAKQEHAQPRLSDTASDRAGQLAGKQLPVEIEALLIALPAQFQLTGERTLVDPDSHARHLESAFEQRIPQQDVAVQPRIPVLSRRTPVVVIGRAADYDDWSTPGEDGYPGLNGDILLWNPLLESAFEVSSMGIRVDERSLARQLELRGERDKESLYFHRKLLAGELPCTIGGGIGQSRLCMFLLRKAHIGEIQSSIWPESMRRECSEAGIELV